MKESFFKRLMQRWAMVVVKFPWVVLGGALLITLLAGYIVKTRFDIRSDIKDLMPENARSVQDTFAISERMGSITTLSILIEVPERVLSEDKKQTDEYQACKTKAIAEWRARQERGIALAYEGERGDPPEVGEPGPEVTEHCDDPLILFSSTLVSHLLENELVGYVHYRQRRAFFEDNLLLYASVSDLERLYEEVDLGLGEARTMSGEYKACLLTATEEGECDALEPTLELLQERRLEAHSGEDFVTHSPTPAPNDQAKTQAAAPDSGEEKAELNEDFIRKQINDKVEGSGINFDEYMIYELSDGAWAAKISVRFKDGSTSLKANKENLAKIEELVDSLEPSSYHPDLKVVYGGGFRTQQEEADAIINDVKFSGGVTIAAISLLLLFFFRRLRALFTLLIPLAMSIVWTFGLTFATIGYLNLITAFIAAILLGLGIDFGIHLLVRFDQERSLGHDLGQAMKIALGEVGSANLAGAATTSATFLTLTLADFRGFSQFGVVACLGVVLALVAMLSVLPALVIATQRIWPTKALVLRGAKVPSTKGIAWLRPFTIVASLVLVAAIGLSISQAHQVGFEDNFYRLGMRKQAWKKDADRYQVTKGSHHSSPAVVLLDSLHEVSALEKVLTKRKDPHKLYVAQKFSWEYPNFFRFMGRTFAASLSQSHHYAAMPAMVTTSGLSPDNWQVVPKYNRYDRLATKMLWQLESFTQVYPTFAHRLTEAFGPALDNSHALRALAPLMELQAELPPWLEPALPSRRSNDKLTSVRDFASIYSFMPGTPSEQLEKLAVIEKLRERTTRRKIRFLPKEDQEQVRQLRRFLVTEAVSVDDLPPWVKLQFKEGGENPAAPREGSGVDYAFGNVMLVYQSTSSMIGEQAHRFTGEMRSVEIEGASPRMATNAFVFSDMLHQIAGDGFRVALYALLIVVFVVLVQFRSVLQTIIVVAPLAVALTWVGGLMAALDLKLGLFNMVMLPVVIGIGIDNGIHLYHRYRENGRGGLFSALRFTGGSIVMTSATTMVGFGGLTLSQHMGLNSMGELALVGIGACLVATLTVQPVLLIFAEWAQLKGLTGTKDYQGASPQPEENA